MLSGITSRILSGGGMLRRSIASDLDRWHTNHFLKGDPACIALYNADKERYEMYVAERLKEEYLGDCNGLLGSTLASGTTFGLVTYFDSLPHNPYLALGCFTGMLGVLTTLEISKFEILRKFVNETRKQ